MRLNSDGNMSIGPTIANHFEHVEPSTLKVVLVRYTQKRCRLPNTDKFNRHTSLIIGNTRIVYVAYTKQLHEGCILHQHCYYSNS